MGEFEKALGIKLKISSVYHPYTGQTIQSLEELLRACALEQKESRDSFLLLIEFAYNNRFHQPLT